MATAGSIDIPEGPVVFDKKNVRNKNEGPNRSTLCNGTIEIRSTNLDLIFSWRPYDESVAYSNGHTTLSHSPQSQRRPHSFWFEMREMKSYLAESKATCFELTFILSDGTRHPTLVFDVGQQSALLEYITDRVPTRNSVKDKRLHIVCRDDLDALQKSFNSLNIFQDDNQTLVERIVRDPLPTFASSLAKVTNFFTQGTSQRQTGRTISEGMLDLNPACYEEFEEVFTVNLNTEPGFDFVEQIQELPAKRVITRIPSLGLDEWLSYFDADGRILQKQNLLERIFRGGCRPEIRSEAWKFLLGVHDYGTTAKERAVEHSRLTEEYYRMKLQWKSFTPEQESRFSAYCARKNLVEKDVNRTDRTVDIFEGDGNEYLSMLSDVLMTYIMYDFDLGYVQGMSDLLSPILSVMQNEPDSFWCFAKFISKIRGNFIDHDKNEERDQRQLGMKLQLERLHQLLCAAMPSFAAYLDDHDSGNLYFCFRWLLIWFKREFSFEDTKRLWEVLWTGLPCENFHLLFCTAILDEERIRITENNFGLTEILKHINDMSYKIALEDNLIRAEQLYFQLLEFPKVAEIFGLTKIEKGENGCLSHMNGDNGNGQDEDIVKESICG